MLMGMKAIVAVDEAWGIGKDGSLLFSIPEDMRFFRQTTAGHTVVMGRETLRSLPGGRPLPKRDNIVLSRDPSFSPEGVRVARSLGELAAMLGDEQTVYVMGGESVYRQLLPYCEEALVTRVAASRPADRHFPALEEQPGWTLVGAEPVQSETGLSITFCRYRN
ncbi:MAG: dihydrofolate reductase, partial [Clostridia bacterium]|nr:dihydrofolate reductase [Clostridia bacterium]